ncbi:penicillin-binding protein 2 [Persephonella atlantica]|uniref:Penicillin-binding protein 2 n=1 Tax=Persephonella atlantica TaxID=2699429 RepID=A0ABS1GFA1_9AQUI|nr:penicillin-binding protein 2 [Persephonella atlantica]MBK3331600.1 penicillin-binding protein 2 [Persephonella atlantica]
MVKKKVYIVSFLIVAGFLIVILRLLYFQVIKRDEYTQFIKKQYYTQEKIILPRGTIYDKNGKILAISVPTIDVFVLTKHIKNRDRLAKELSIILKKPYSNILKKLSSHRNYVVIARNVDKSLKDRLLKIRRDLKEWNLGLIDSSKRFYPLGSIGGSNIGFVSRVTGKGMEGLELKYDSKLGGGTGKILMMKDALGNPFTIEKEDEKNRYDIKLTIDSNIQYIAQEALKKFVRERKPKEALILIVDPKTGNIIANATYPDYNPNLYWKYTVHKNISFQNAYEPGSLVKPFVLAEAIDEGKVSFKRKYYCGDGKIVVDGVKIRDHKRFKFLTPDEIIIHSSNVGAITLALRLDPEKFYDRLLSLGFGKSTKTFPGEAKGLIKKSKRPVDIAYASIGQNWTATPIQIAMAYSAIANGGYLLKPNFIKEIINPQTGKTIKVEKKIIGKVFSDRSLKKLKSTLKLVVEEGTAKKGKSKYFTIAGKTGTAQKYDPKIKALSKEKFYTWFAGYFPAENPQFTVVIFANEPKKIKKWEVIGGGSVSAPVLRELVDRIMFYMKGKPDKVGGKNGD